MASRPNLIILISGLGILVIADAWALSAYKEDAWGTHITLDLGANLATKPLPVLPGFSSTPTSILAIHWPAPQAYTAPSRLYASRDAANPETHGSLQTTPIFTLLSCKIIVTTCQLVIT